MRDTTEATLQLAIELDFIVHSDYEHPSNMCGPLAINVLNDLNVLPEGVELDHRNFWLATPDLLDSYLPEKDFTRTYFDSDIGDFDFSSYPLAQGDFIYLQGGDFDHMLVVSEIDSQGRPHTITNVEQLDHSFLVQDVILDDPLNPDSDMFTWWSTNTKVGRTGKTGFYVWRSNSNEQSSIAGELPLN